MKTLLLNTLTLVLITSCSNTQKTFDEDRPLNQSTLQIVAENKKAQIITKDSTFTFVVADSIIGTPPPWEMPPWGIPQPWPPITYDWYGFTLSLVWFPTQREADYNDRIYKHTILANNCYQLQKEENKLEIQIEIRQEHLLNCSIEQIGASANSVNLKPSWLNCPIQLTEGDYFFSIATNHLNQSNYLINLSSNDESTSIRIRI